VAWLSPQGFIVMNLHWAGITGDVRVHVTSEARGTAELLFFPPFFLPFTPFFFAAIGRHPRFRLIRAGYSPP